MRGSRTFAALFLGVTLCASPAAAQEKVILDSDYMTIGDDGQVGVMAMQLHAQGVIRDSTAHNQS